MTRLPTKRMATACWTFIVAKSARLETAPTLDFLSLQAANIKSFPHFIHKALWISWGYFEASVSIAPNDKKSPVWQRNSGTNQLQFKTMLRVSRHQHTTEGAYSAFSSNVTPAQNLRFPAIRKDRTIYSVVIPSIVLGHNPETGKAKTPPTATAEGSSS